MTDPWMEGLPTRPARKEPRIDIACARYFAPVEVTILSARVVLRLKHYDLVVKRPYPCPDPGKCPACEAGMFTYLTGWFAACCTRSYRLWINQLSEAALFDLHDWSQTHPVTRGLILKTTRQDTRVNAKMRAEIKGRDVREYLPPAFDPRPRLEQIWGLAAARLLRETEMGGKEMAKIVARMRGNA